MTTTAPADGPVIGPPRVTLPVRVQDPDTAVSLPLLKVQGAVAALTALDTLEAIDVAVQPDGRVAASAYGLQNVKLALPASGLVTHVLLAPLPPIEPVANP